MRRSLEDIKQNRGDLVIIRKTNDLIEARYKMSMWEVRVWDKFLSLMRHEKEIGDEYKVEINEIIRNYQLEGDKRAFQRIIQAAHSLQDRYITDSAISRDELRHLRSHVFASIEVVITRNGDSHILFEVPKKLKPILKANRERYKDFLLENFVGMSSFYSKRMYEILKQYEFIGHRVILVDDLRNVLAIGEDEYKLYGHFKKRVVEKAQEDCARCSDITFDFEEVKKGRAVHSLKFIIHSNAPRKMARLALAASGSPAERFPKNRKKGYNGPDLFSQAIEILPELGQLPEITPHEEVSVNPLFLKFFTRLNEWWGLEDEEFTRRLDGKTADEIENAIAFTKERIKAGKAFNPAGVFLDALSKGHKTPEQIREAKEIAQKQRAAERELHIKKLVEDYDKLLEQYAAGIRETVRNITSETPEVTEEVVREIKTSQSILGNRQIKTYSVEEFRKDPVLRGMVISAIMEKFPERFQYLREEIAPAVEAAKAKVLAIEPGHHFQ